MKSSTPEQFNSPGKGDCLVSHPQSYRRGVKEEDRDKTVDRWAPTPSANFLRE